MDLENFEKLQWKIREHCQWNGLGNENQDDTEGLTNHGMVKLLVIRKDPYIEG